MMNVLMVSSEVVPFSKTGGLADVIGSLPLALLDKGVDVRIIMPLYNVIPEELRAKMTYKKVIYIKLGWRNQYCGILECEHRGVKFYFIDNEYYFKRSGLYGYMDEAERFAYFCKAVLEAIPHLDFIPDIIHCHDWQSGMIPVFLEASYRNIEPYTDIRTVFTVHNLKYQGVFPKTILDDILDLGDEFFTSDKLEFHGGVSFIKGGLVYANLLSTVSPSYAQEIQTPYFGEGLDGLLSARSQSLAGVLNGIDYVEYDPLTDPLIFASYSLDDIEGKNENKKRLQDDLGLDESLETPVVGIVTRLVAQKGLDLIAYVFDEILSTGVQIAVLGTGEERFERMFLDAASRYKGRVSANIKFDNKLAHRIYAGSDMFLMPSEFEPCGLGQIISLRYGTIPIVRETGGLRNSVQPYNEFTMEGNGFSFSNYNAHEMLYTIKKAVGFYKRKEMWKKLVIKAMSCNFSWDASALQYIKLYKRLKEL